MRTGRNCIVWGFESVQSLDHWDMRTGRNEAAEGEKDVLSLDHWDMPHQNNPQKRTEGNQSHRAVRANAPPPGLTTA